MWDNLPTIMPGGDLMPHMSARLRTQVIDALFIGVGGYERAKSWIETSDDNYREFFRIYAKGAARPVNIELQAADSVEALLLKLDEAEKADRAIDITPDEDSGERDC